MSWIFEGKEYLSADPEYYGFIYRIDNLINGKKYIGRKYLTAVKVRQVKGKKKRSRVESDWKDYYGSSDSLKSDIEKYGKENFQRTIIMFCKTRGECNYQELKAIIDANAILDGNYYNNWVSGKVHANHVKSLLYNQEEKD